MATSVVKVNILGDAADLKRAFSNAEQASRSFGDRIQDNLRTVGRFALNAAKVIAGIGAAIVGLTLKGGLDRALNIEDAQAKLRGLGHDTQTVETIMNSALESVKGTAFGLDAAAGAAASAVAAGIEPGKELTRVLGLTADSATIMGRSFGEAGAIINKVLASNRLSMEEVNQLHDAGLPILSMLADQYGVTAEAMRDMVSQGIVDSEAFLQAIETNISGAALESGETTRGALANVGAAFSRLGATIVEKFFPLAKGVFEGIIEGVDNMTSMVGPAMEAFANSDFFQTLEEHVRRIPEYMASVAEGLVDFWESTKFVRDNVGTAIVGLVALIESEMGKAVIAVGALKLALDALKRNPLIAAAAAIGFAAGKIKEHVDDIQDPINELKDQFDELSESAKVEVFRRAIEEAWGPEAVATIERFLARSGASIEEFAGTTDGVARLIEMSGQDIGDTWEEVERQIGEQSRLAIEHIESMGPHWEGSGSSAGEFEVKVGEAAEGVGGSTGEIEGDLEEMAAKADEVFEQVEGDVDDFITGFEEIPEKTDISLQEWIDNMNARNVEIEAWFDNLNFLRANGMTEFVEEMEQAGVESSAGLVQEAVDAINDGDTGLPYLANEAAKGAEEVGSRLAQGAADGVRKGAAQVAFEAEEMVREALRRARGASGIRSPSELFAKELGEPIAEGVAAGISGSDAPSRAITNKVGSMAATDVNGANGSAVAPQTALNSEGMRSLAEVFKRALSDIGLGRSEVNHFHDWKIESTGNRDVDAQLAGHLFSVVRRMETA